MLDLPVSLKDRVAIITGAGQGIGRATAMAFAEAGAIPVIAELDEDKATAVAREIGNRAMAVKTDAANADSLAEMTATVMKAHGRIDILVNNAAIFSTLEMRPFWEIPEEEWNRVMHVNATGPFLATRAVLGAMREEGWGRVINISSGAVTMGRPNYLHYIASKSALIGMTRSMGRELGDSGITVNAILPGAVFTEVPRKTVTAKQKEMILAMQSIQRPQEPGDLLGTILFLASESSSFMTGQCVTVDGGTTYA